MSKNFSVTLSDENCAHSEDCGCVIKVVGVSPMFRGLVVEGTEGSTTERMLYCADRIEAFLSGHYSNKDNMMSEQNYFKTLIPAGSNMTLINPPINAAPLSWPNSTGLFSLHPLVDKALRLSDYRFLENFFKRKDKPRIDISWSFLEKEVWNKDKPSSLLAQGVRLYSAYHWSCGHTNGRPHVISAASDLYPYKMGKAAAQVARVPPGPAFAEAMKHTPSTLDHMYRMLDINLDCPTHVPFTLGPLNKMYMGASAGKDGYVSYEIPASDDNPTTIHVSSSGKKAEHMEQYFAQILDLLTNGEEPHVEHSMPHKVENYFSFTKQHDDTKWYEFTQKCRVFNIPTGIYILLERICSMFRHLKERGRIRIGHKWSHGGMDTLAELLGVTMENCDNPEWVESDVKSLDQGVVEQIINLYFSTMHIHQVPSEDRKVFEYVTKFLLKVMLNRLTRVFGDVWAIIKGGVPSGAYNTSHIDSWVMLFYFCNFCVYTIATEPDLELREKLEIEFFTIIRIIVYGDDNVYRKGLGLGKYYFSGQAFAKFLSKHFNVDLRDIKDGIPFVSIAEDGFIIRMGTTFLKYQAVKNDYRDQPGQPKFLPYRESREILIRTVWGRETKVRDEIDTLISIIGHAYGTYASNRDAYDRLKLFYVELANLVGLDKLDDRIRDRCTRLDLKKFRQMGITAEDIIHGFPDWEILIGKNSYDANYQRIKMTGLDDYYYDDYELDFSYL